VTGRCIDLPNAPKADFQRQNSDQVLPTVDAGDLIWLTWDGREEASFPEFE